MQRRIGNLLLSALNPLLPSAVIQFLKVLCGLLNSPEPSTSFMFFQACAFVAILFKLRFDEEWKNTKLLQKVPEASSCVFETSTIFLRKEKKAIEHNESNKLFQKNSQITYQKLDTLSKTQRNWDDLQTNLSIEKNIANKKQLCN